MFSTYQLTCKSKINSHILLRIIIPAVYIMHVLSIMNDVPLQHSGIDGLNLSFCLPCDFALLEDTNGVHLTYPNFTKLYLRTEQTISLSAELQECSNAALNFTTSRGIYRLCIIIYLTPSINAGCDLSILLHCTTHMQKSLPLHVVNQFGHWVICD